jgi:imidazolonepropionase-like amidohydrolase
MRENRLAEILVGAPLMLRNIELLLIAPFIVTSGLLTFAPPLHATQRPVAFVDVTVVPMDKDEILPHQTVVVTDGRITQLATATSIKVPRNAVKVDGKGKFLMPGMADMHVHFIRAALPVESQPDPPADSRHRSIVPASASADHERENQAFGLLFIANGVTTVRNMWGGPAIDAFAKEVDSGRAIGPHIYSTGPVTDGNPPLYLGARIVETQSQAEAAVKQDKESGYVALKVYNGLSADAYKWLVASARDQGLQVVGHVPYSIGLRGVVAARQDSIEHMDDFIAELQPESSPGANASWRQMVERADLSKLPMLAESIRAAGAWVCPTVVLDEVFPEDTEWRRRIALIPPAIIARYHKMFTHWQDDAAFTRQSYQLEIAIVRGLHRGGVHLLLGTDAMKLTVLPGFSLHAELQTFVAAGLTPYEAIRAGTADAALFLRQQPEFGTVAVGRRADLVLLRSSPLQDVGNVSKRVGVMANGRWYSEAELQQQLARLRNGT